MDPVTIAIIAAGGSAIARGIGNIFGNRRKKDAAKKQQKFLREDARKTTELYEDKAERLIEQGERTLASQRAIGWKFGHDPGRAEVGTEEIDHGPAPEVRLPGMPGSMSERFSERLHELRTRRDPRSIQISETEEVDRGATSIQQVQFTDAQMIARDAQRVLDIGKQEADRILHGASQAGAQADALDAQLPWLVGSSVFDIFGSSLSAGKAWDPDFLT